MISLDDPMRGIFIMNASRLVLVLALASATATAQVYERIGPNGEIYLSDRPGPDARRIDVPPPQTVTLPPVPPRSGRLEGQGGNAANPAAPGYTAFSIVSPGASEGVRANDGNVTVRLALEPQLAAGHVIRLNVDGEDGVLNRSGANLDFPLTNLSRGRHSVEAQVMDVQGNVLMSTGPVIFYVLRFAGGPASGGAVHPRAR
jgi:hypothetical protein